MVSHLSFQRIMFLKLLNRRIFSTQVQLERGASLVWYNACRRAIRYLSDLYHRPFYSTNGKHLCRFSGGNIFLKSSIHFESFSKLENSSNRRGLRLLFWDVLQYDFNTTVHVASLFCFIRCDWAQVSDTI